MSTRRNFIFNASLFLVGAGLPGVAVPVMAQGASGNQHKDTDLIPDATPLADPVVARKLLKMKVDYAFFHDPQVMKRIHAMFPKMPDPGPTVTRFVTNVQIKNSIEIDYMNSNGPRDWGRAKFYWRRRFGHRIYEALVPKYDETLNRLLKEDPNISPMNLRNKANAQYVSETEGLCDPAKFAGECTMGRLLGREKFDAAGRLVSINDNWKNEPASLWDRPIFDFDRMFKVAGISPYALNATWGDLARADKAAKKHHELHKYDPADTDIGDGDEDDDAPNPAMPAPVQPAAKKAGPGQTPSNQASPRL